MTSSGVGTAGFSATLNGERDNSETLAQDPFSILTASSALSALTYLETLSDRLGNVRSRIGAHLSRVQSASSLLSATGEQLKAAESRIMDVDIASESANFVAQTIRQQATAAVLAQANTQPQLVLQLIRSD